MRLLNQLMPTYVAAFVKELISVASSERRHVSRLHNLSAMKLCDLRLLLSKKDLHVRTLCRQQSLGHRHIFQQFLDFSVQCCRVLTSTLVLKVLLDLAAVHGHETILHHLIIS